MEINESYLSIPPFLSTPWKQVRSLHRSKEALVVTLSNNQTISLPGLSEEMIEQLFDRHARFLDQQGEGFRQKNSIKALHKQQLNEDLALLPTITSMQMAFSPETGLILSHQPEQAGLPPIPEEALIQVIEIARQFTPENSPLHIHPESNCNCPGCQVGRFIVKKAALNHPEMDKEEEESVSDEELKFSSWAITAHNDLLFTVANPLEPDESYLVSLQEPINCSCKAPHCPHLLAVLRS